MSLTCRSTMPFCPWCPIIRMKNKTPREGFGATSVPGRPRPPVGTAATSCGGCGVCAESRLSHSSPPWRSRKRRSAGCKICSGLSSPSCASPPIRVNTGSRCCVGASRSCASAESRGSCCCWMWSGYSRRATPSTRT